MIHLALLLGMMFTNDEPVTRVEYDVQVQDGEKRIGVRMIVHVRSTNHLSIHCRKAPSGALFTYWATPDQDTLLFHKQGEAYVGKAGERFHIFPDGPALDRSGWYQLIFEDEPGQLGDYAFSEEGGWRILKNPKQGVDIRWRERSRVVKNSVGRRVLHPSLKKKTKIHSLTSEPVRMEWQ